MKLRAKLSDVTALAMVVSSSLIVVGAYWDFWWHLHFGREDFWLPPHILIYSMLASLLVVNAFELVRSRNFLAGRNLAVFGGFVGFIAAGMWDDQWHRIHGPDNFNFSLVSLRTLSPPHALAVVSGLLLGIGVMVRLIARYENERTTFNSLLLSTYYSAGLGAVLFGSIVFVPNSADMDLRLFGSLTFSFFVALFAIGTSRYLKSSLVVVQSILLAGILQASATNNLAYLAMFGVAGVGFVTIALANGRYISQRTIPLSGSIVSGSALIAYLALSGASLNWLVFIQGGIAAMAGGLGALLGSRSMIPRIGLGQDMPATISGFSSTSVVVSARNHSDFPIGAKTDMKERN